MSKPTHAPAALHASGMNMIPSPYLLLYVSQLQIVTAARTEVRGEESGDAEKRCRNKSSVPKYVFVRFHHYEVTCSN